ncbi:galactose-specific lectin nattectin-like [Dreissena polymorpha]|uniref:C-type lectin domain-containing protein n=1 Tax=Dreissena polymorpha TaxID=45954 RepID=A0A9D4QVB5_DREPO|nr:galactose-specific lectin nattectin-like [Dreissena polymorpha]KAH3844874.1 hypothetical protein DPMN_087140 [Dreissena polymorpha]
MMIFIYSILLIPFLQSSFGCNSGWTSYRGRCYFISHDQQSWVAAEGICLNLGGHLAEINDERENNFLQHSLVDIVNKQAWVGGTDVGVEGDWFWALSKTDIYPPNYVNWQPGEPNSWSGHDENCMDLRPHALGWNDETCSVALNYICETL